MFKEAFFMLKKIVIAYFLFFATTFCHAQKVIQKEFSSEGIQTLSIADDAIYKITLHSSEESSIKVSLHISGEHFETIIIEEKIFEETLSLKTGFLPFFTLENDKLAAHKLMGIEVEVTVPENLEVEIKSKLTSVIATGTFKNLNISLENGSCSLYEFLGNAHLKTRTGNITVQAQNEVAGKTISKKGTIVNKLSSQGRFLVFAESTNGNIWLLQTK